MATSRSSSAPMFPSVTDVVAGLTEDTGYDPIIKDRGANQFLGHQATSHDDQSTVGPRGNRMQDGSLALLGTHNVLGRPTKSNPTGSQNG
jgi:hypothetical protein